MILVGVDGSAPARRALEWAAAEARLRACELVVVHAYYDPRGERADSAPATLARRDLEAALDGFEPDGVVVHPRLVEGTVAAALLREARGAELLVVGSRHPGRGVPPLDSVGLACARHASCPVVVVPTLAGPAGHGRGLAPGSGTPAGTARHTP